MMGVAVKILLTLAIGLILFQSPFCLAFSSVAVVRRYRSSNNNKNVHVQHQQPRAVPFSNAAVLVARLAPTDDVNDKESIISTTSPDGASSTISNVNVSTSSNNNTESSGDNLSLSLPSLDFGAVKDNVLEGEFGTRGELYFAVQAVLVVCIVLGGVPFVGDKLTILLGPGLLIAGIIVIIFSTLELGDSLSPWPVPPEKAGGLKTGGLYGELRHPMYAGILAAAAGLSVVTGSATRLLLTAVLLYALDVMSDFEEEALLKKFPEYAEYQKTVTGKFFPNTLLQILPWTKKSDEEDEKSLP